MLRPLLLASLSALAGAQTYTVSPPFYGTFEGNTATSYPFSSASFRYQQIHDDLRGSAMTITAIAFRRDGNALAPTLGVARAIDLDLAMGGGDARTATAAFAGNYLSAPATVYVRKIVNLPDRTPPPSSRPMPFDVVLPLDNAFPHGGQHDLLWELRAWSNSAFSDQHYLSDAARADDPIPAAHNALGLGCNTDRFNPLQIMRLSATVYLDRAGALQLAWTCIDAPSSSPVAVVLLGTTNPSVLVPGLCGSRIHTDAAINLPPERPVSAVGGFRTAGATVPWSPAFARARIYAQAAAADPNQFPLPIAASNGVETDLPPGLPPAFELRHVPATSVNATSGLGVFGGGAIVRFTR